MTSHKHPRMKPAGTMHSRDMDRELAPRGDDMHRMFAEMQRPDYSARIHPPMLPGQKENPNG